ncbi:MAG: efflux RND transporter permease subunit [Phycisphaeraceae bacterium]|nr:efflux RND transporter permease subunit [Phycisphaeraceae bacterium]
MSLSSFGVRKPVVANLVMFALIGAGLIFGLSLRREFFPEVRPNLITITAPYPGASPSEVEKSLAVKIEDAVIDVDGIKELNTVASEGVCSVTLELEDGIDVDAAVFEVKRKIDALQDLPDESERIIVAELEPNFPVINLSLFGDGDPKVMKDAIREIEADLRSLADRGMGDIVVSGVRGDEIKVEVSPSALLEHSVSLPTVADRIRQSMLELPGGAVRSGTNNTAVRTLGAEETAEEVRRVVIKAEDGRVVRLDEIADVREDFEEVDLFSRLNGKPAVSLTIYKSGKKDAVEMAELVKAYAAGRRGETIRMTLSERVASMMRPPAPEGTTPEPASNRLAAYQLGTSHQKPLPGELAVTTDLARFIVGRLELLSRNALQGGVLVLITLVLLLNFRVAFWVAVGLVISILGTLAAMHFAGITLNLLTMFGLIIVLGLLVDDAIVVAENITARHERGEPPIEAAVRGTHEVNWPVIATVLTTCLAFMPLSLIEGQIGDLLGILPLVVVVALSVSLIECLFILPPHMAHSLAAADKGHSAIRKIERKFDTMRERWIKRRMIPAYAWLLEKCLRARYLTLAGAVALLIASVGMMAGGRVPFDYFSSSDSETVNIQLRMPVGTPIAETDAVVRKIEAAANAQPEISAVFAAVGETASIETGQGAQQSHIAQVILELVPVEERERSSREINRAIREQIGTLAGIKDLRFEEITGGPSGADIQIGIVGEDIERIAQATMRIRDVLGGFDGVYDISDDNDAGRRELQLRLRDGASELGFTTENIARQVRGAVFGLEAHTFAGTREDVDVRVIYPEQDRRSLAAIENMFVFTPGPESVPVPLSEVVAVEETQGYATIRRLDRDRVVTVSASVDRSVVASPEEVTRELAPILAGITDEIPGIRLVERGRQKSMKESFSTLPLGMMTAIGLIYIVLVWLFGSFVQPIIVLTAVPFATIGMIWGHFVLGYDMTFLSLIGFVALSGVVVNDSLIFMEFFNHRKRDGLTTMQACLETGRARLRAILLTTITTVLGLLPLMLEQSFQAKFLIPMAITIACGLMSATFLVLLVLPCLLMILDDAKRVVSFLWNGRWPERSAATDSVSV